MVLSHIFVHFLKVVIQLLSMRAYFFEVRVKHLFFVGRVWSFLDRGADKPIIIWDFSWAWTQSLGDVISVWNLWGTLLICKIDQLIWIRLCIFVCVLVFQLSTFFFSARSILCASSPWWRWQLLSGRILTCTWLSCLHKVPQLLSIVISSHLIVSSFVALSGSWCCLSVAKLACVAKTILTGIGHIIH